MALSVELVNGMICSDVLSFSFVRRRESLRLDEHGRGPHVRLTSNTFSSN